MYPNGPRLSVITRGRFNERDEAESCNEFLPLGVMDLWGSENVLRDYSAKLLPVFQGVFENLRRPPRHAGVDEEHGRPVAGSPHFF
jgi:hypothetical protein